MTEYCPYALDAILSGGRVADDVLRGANGKPRQTPRLTVAARTTIFYQVALALQYLHAERVLHHDLKPGNILLDRDFTAKVSDFGLAQLVADTEDVVSKGPTKAPSRMSAGLRPVYAAPEMLLKLRGRFKDRPDRGENSSDSTRDMSDSGRVVAGNFDELSKLDVFAYAIVCAAVFSQRGDPYHFYVTNARSPQAREADIADAVRDQGLRPQVPAALPEELRPLMERCWATQPADRPAFREIARRLKAVAVRHGTIVPTTSPPNCRSGRRRAARSRRRTSSFSRRKGGPARAPVYKRAPPAPPHHLMRRLYPSCLVAVAGCVASRLLAPEPSRLAARDRTPVPPVAVQSFFCTASRPSPARSSASCRAGRAVGAVELQSFF